MAGTSLALFDVDDSLDTELVELIDVHLAHFSMPRASCHRVSTGQTARPPGPLGVTWLR